MRLAYPLLERRRGRALYTFLWAFCAMLLIGLVADVTQRPYIFPSLGPSAIMMFGRPLRRDSSPRHAILGHGVGALCGYFALGATGLLGVPFSTHVGIARILAAAVALALTSGLTILLSCEHAPAGATTLIVALGILPNPIDFLFLMSAVAMLALLALVINRTFSYEYPVWKAQKKAQRGTQP